MNKPAHIPVTNNREHHQFEAHIDGHTAFASYRQTGDVISFTHTEVPEELEGRGIAAALAKTALDFSRENKLKVMPLCPYFESFIAKHKEYQDLVMEM